MLSRYQQRSGFVDDPAETFLQTLVWLGGYCTSEQARRLGIAASTTRVFARLRNLARRGFLRRVAPYPVVYQVTKLATQLLPKDTMARRPHSIETVRSRLLGVSFYLEARSWPAQFVFGHGQKLAAFQELGCPVNVLPNRSGKPYLWEEFVLRGTDGRLWVAHIDYPHRSAFLQVWGLAKRFCPCLERLGERLQLLVVVGSEARYRRYGRFVRHPRLWKLSQGRFEVPVSLYRLRHPPAFVPSLTWPDKGFLYESSPMRCRLDVKGLDYDRSC